VQTLCLGSEPQSQPPYTVASRELPLVRARLARETGLNVLGPEGCVHQQAASFGSWIVDRATGAPALLLGVAPPRPVARDTMEVFVSKRVAGRWGKGWRCLVAKRDTLWVVPPCVPTWKS
jgi:hypothetical protein